MPSPVSCRISGAPALVMSVALALGALGAVGAYRAVAQVGAPAARDVPVAAVPSNTAVARRPRTIVRWAPCTPPAVLRHGVCVTEKVREVVLAAPVSVVRTPVAAPSAGGRRHGGTGSSHGSGSHHAEPADGPGDREGDHSDSRSEDGPEHEAPESPEQPENEAGD